MSGNRPVIPRSYWDMAAEPKYLLDFDEKHAMTALAKATIGCGSAALSGLVDQQVCVFATTDGFPSNHAEHAKLVHTVMGNGTLAWASIDLEQPAHYLGVPLKVDGENTVGVLTLFDLGEEKFDPQHHEAIKNLQHVFGSLLKTHEAQRIADEKQAELSLTFEYMDQGITVFDAEARLTFWNQRYIEIFGINPTMAKKGVSLRDILADQQRDGGFEGFNTEDYDIMLGRLREGLASGEPVEAGVRLANGRIISSIHTATPDGGWIATHSDVTDRVLAQEKVEHASEHDSLTGLVNRSKFSKEFRRLSAAKNRLVAMLVDIDHFKSVNDTFGHAAGDAVIVDVAERLKGCVRQNDVVARLGGDEFAILLSIGRNADGSSPERIAQSVVNRMQEKLVFENQAIDFSVSIGAYEVPIGCDDIDVSLSRADYALYRAKEDGRGKHQFFNDGLAIELERARLSSSMVTKETYDEKLTVHFQPIVCMNTDRDCSYEALIRWVGQDSDYLSPIAIIEAAEQNGAISCLGGWVLNKALEAYKTWNTDARIAVNLSPRQLGSGVVFEQVKQALDHHGVSPTSLELEVTETAVLQDDDSFKELHDLKAFGVQINLDDFGTGHSSLTLLQRFPFDKLKIDRSFIKQYDEEPLSTAIVRSVVGLAKDLNLETIAEGIETDQQLTSMKNLGCALGQGHFLGRPVDQTHIVQRQSGANCAA